jgi:hypothetical protein
MHGLVASQICSIRKNINQHYNIDILQCLQQEKEQRKQHEKLDSGDWFLHHDKLCSACGSLSQKQNDWHPTTSLLSGFRAIWFLSFPKLKTVLGRRRFNDNRYVSKQSPNILTEYQAMHCTKYLEKWCNHWACCVQSKRDYFEVENID